MARHGAIRELEGLPNWPALMTAPVAAAFLSLPEADFDRGVAHGALPAPQTVIGRTLWSRAALERFCDEGAPRAPSAAPSAAAPVADPIAARIARVGRVR